VTPIEVLLLVAEHHKNNGGCPVEVQKDTVTEVKTEVEVMEGTPPKVVKKLVDRTDDDELGRLRARYGKAKVKALLSEVRTLPKDFDEALKKGIELVLPSSATFAESGKA
jgi:hypothetical protein